MHNWIGLYRSFYGVPKIWIKKKNFVRSNKVPKLEIRNIHKRSDLVNKTGPKLEQMCNHSVEFQESRLKIVIVYYKKFVQSFINFAEKYPKIWKRRKRHAQTIP